MVPELEAGVAARIEERLSTSPTPLTVKEMARDLEVSPSEIAEIVWGSPHAFSWQPGGRWTLAVPKSAVLPPVETTQADARQAVLSPYEGVELRAIHLRDGVTLRVVGQPLDSASLFTVKTAGSDLQLILNTAHEAFETLPMPFEEGANGDYKAFAELLLAAWAVYEGEAPPAARRSLEDARLLWGRRLLDLLEPKP